MLDKALSNVMVLLPTGGMEVLFYACITTENLTKMPDAHVALAILSTGAKLPAS
jgi:hypothetical protein